MKELDQVNYFGVRHLSPGASWHLRSFLDENRPDLVLIEGFSDANSIVPYLMDKELRPPVALLAYSKTLPVKTLIYPLAEYSPEFQALKSSAGKNAQAAFIDLPSGVFMGLSEKQFRGGKESSYLNIYEELSRAAGENSYDAHWERSYEHIKLKGSFREMVLELGKTMRLIEENDRDYFRAENLVREAFMRRKICSYLEQGYKPEKIVVVAGAYHVPSFNSREHVMTCKEEAALKCIDCSLALMPYSYSRLSSQSGYGAGNPAPAYFELLWDLLQEGKLEELPSIYLTRLVEGLRRKGYSRSSAHIIEAARLAQSLASLKSGAVPVLADLKDAAETVIGEGSKTLLKECMNELEVGNLFGQLAPNSLKTSVQEDFERNMKALNLERFRQNFIQDLKLDLRENLNAKSRKSAFLSLRRSFFLHRLKFLNISFGNLIEKGDREWTENWQLNWLPESEIALVETVLLAETIELASAVKFNHEIKECKDVKKAASLLKLACECGLTKELLRARSLLQNLAAESTDFISLSQTCFELSALIRFGSARQLDVKDFIPLLEELFNEAVLLMVSSANCNAEAVDNAIKAVDLLHLTASSSKDIVDCKLYEAELKDLSYRDDLNPTLSGYGTALLLENNLISDSELSREFCRRVSPGVDADLGAGWFEGLAKRNRMLLVRKKNIWDQLSSYIASLDEEQFKRALVFMRRTFADFAPSEIKAIAGTVCALLGVAPEVEKAMTKLELSEAEMEMLEDLDL